MKVAIFEIEHFESAYALIRLFDTAENQLTIFTSHACRVLLAEMLGKDTQRFTWIIQGDHQPHRRFLWQMYRYLATRQTDLLFLSTVSHNHLLHAMIVSLLPHTRCVLTVHAIRSMFHHPWYRTPKHLIIGAGKKMLLSRLRELNVLSDTLLPSLRSYTRRHVIHQVPGGIREEAATVHQGGLHPDLPGERLNLVVCGTIQRHRRNYEEIFELLARASSAGLHLHVNLAGSAADEYGRDVIRRAAAFHKEHISIACSDGSLLSQQLYDETIANAHFVYIPAPETTADDYGITEVYGKTKVTGAFFDAVRHAKPMLLPLSLEPPVLLRDACFHYENKDQLVAFLESISAVPAAYRKWANDAISCSASYSPTAVRSRNKLLFGTQS